MAGREIPEGILQIRNGKIAQVGARGEVKLQPEEGEQVVIAKNALIMPGIIEAHFIFPFINRKTADLGTIQFYRQPWLHRVVISIYFQPQFTASI